MHGNTPRSAACDARNKTLFQKSFGLPDTLRATGRSLSLPPAGARAALPAELLQHVPARVTVVPTSPGEIESRAGRADLARAFAAGDGDRRVVGTSQPQTKERKAA